MKDWLAVHNAAVMTVLFLVFGVDLIAKGLGAADRLTPAVFRKRGYRSGDIPEHWPQPDPGTPTYRQSV